MARVVLENYFLPRKSCALFFHATVAWDEVRHKFPSRSSRLIILSSFVEDVQF